MARLLKSTAWFYLALTALVILSPGVASAREGKPAPAPKSLRDYASSVQGRFAYGVYLKNKKVGWEIEEFKIGKRDGQDVLVVTNESYLSFAVDGEKSVTRDKTVLVYELTGEGTILQAEVTAKEDERTTIRQAVRTDKGMKLTTTEGRRKSTRTIAVPKDSLAREQKFEAWLRSGPKKGDRFTKYSVAWDQEEVDVEEVYIFKEKKILVLGGVETPVAVVDVEALGAREEAQLLQDGRTLTTTLAGLLTLKLETEAIAQKIEGGEVDLMAATSIVVDTDLGRGSQIEKLTLQIKGLGDFPLPESHRQKLQRHKDKVILTLTRDFQLGKGAPLSKEDREKYLKATPSIQCDHEAIRSQARKIVGKETDPLKMASLLEKWVYKTLRKSYSDNADNALAVLDRKAGDCTEHTVLFVALARALGLPAREVGGVAFVKGSKPLFGWHAWAEIHDGKQWVTIDPTWNQVYVDATHIKVSEGSRDLRWINLVGQLEVKVVSYEKK